MSNTKLPLHTVGIVVNKEQWLKFRAATIEDGTSASSLFRDYIDSWLEKRQASHNTETPNNSSSPVHEA